MTNKTQVAPGARFRFNRNSPLGRFWRWWSGELLAVAPDWLKQSNASVGTALLIEVSARAIVMRRWLQGALVEQGRIDLQNGDHATHSIAFQALFGKLHQRGELIALWLPESQSLIKQLDLPLAAAENLRQVLGFEMDRHTPFKADQVYFDFRVVQRDAKSGRISIKLAVVPRQTIDSAVELLAKWGAPIQAAYIASAATPDADTINLIPSERRIAAPSRLRGLNLGLLLLILALGTAAISIPIMIKRQASIALIPLVERAKQVAGSTDSMKREYEKQAAEYNFMLDKKKTGLPVIVLLDEVSRLLPDDTWVQQFSLNGKEMQIQGETGSSSKLIALVESARVLHDANFRSPISKGNTPNSERFHLAAEVKPLPPEELAAGVARAPAPAPAVPAPVAPASPPQPGAAPAPAGTAAASGTAPAARPAPSSAAPANAQTAPGAGKPANPASGPPGANPAPNSPVPGSPVPASSAAASPGPATPVPPPAAPSSTAPVKPSAPGARP